MNRSSYYNFKYRVYYVVRISYYKDHNTQYASRNNHVTT
jgi:hypothetical protein